MWTLINFFLLFGQTVYRSEVIDIYIYIYIAINMTLFINSQRDGKIERKQGLYIGFLRTGLLALKHVYCTLTKSLQ